MTSSNEYWVVWHGNFLSSQIVECICISCMGTVAIGEEREPLLEGVVLRVSVILISLVGNGVDLFSFQLLRTTMYLFNKYRLNFISTSMVDNFIVLLL